MTKRKAILYSLLSGLILAAAWPPEGFPFLLFIAFIPLLYVEHYASGITNTLKASFIFYSFCLSFFIWNVLTIWWLYNATFAGLIVAILTNTLSMSITFFIFHSVKKIVLRSGFPKTNYIIFLLIPLWISFELIHHHWDLTFPWLTLGNAFSKNYKWIQWFEYTGVFGGSLWVLLVNILIFQIALNVNENGVRALLKKSAIIKLAVTVDILILPIIISYIIYNNYQEKNNPVNVVVVQPNIDPYNEKFTGSYGEQLNKMLALAENKIDPTTDFIVFPETALTENIWENTIENSGSILLLKNFLKKYPQIKIITGAATAYEYQPGETHTLTTKKFRDAEIYYEDYNTALQIDTNCLQKYHKSKFVPGVEKMPWAWLLKPLEKFALDLGGTTGSLCGQDSRGIFTSHSMRDTFRIAPVICYESVYGEFVNGYINNGANIIFIITNDGWWGDTPGYHQNLLYGRLRAIETRRSIARSANTGTSCFINQTGDISQATDWWQPIAIKGSVNLNDKNTFYTMYGDYIAWAAAYISFLIIGYVAFVKFKLRNNDPLDDGTPNESFALKSK